jgi:hypothetical protein
MERGGTMIVNGEAKALHAGLKEIIRTSVQVMYSIGWRDTLFMRSAFGSIVTVDDAALAYGYSETSCKQFSAREISRAEMVESWLAWLSLQPDGIKQAVRIDDWARGIALWQMAQRENCSERTVVNRIDRSMALILAELFNVHVEIKTEFEKLETHPLAFLLEKPKSGYAGERTNFGKAFVAGVGFVRNGKPLRDGRHKAEDKRLHRERS